MHKGWLAFDVFERISVLNRKSIVHVSEFIRIVTHSLA